MKTRWVVIIVTAVILFSFGISTFSSILSLSTLVESSNAKEAELVLREVQSDVTDSFSGSVSVSEAMNNTFIRNLIDNRESYTDEEVSECIGQYLEGIKTQFGFDTAFMIIDCTQEYYSEHGKTKVLNTIGEDDIWYTDFKSSGKSVELNVDNDQANNNRMTVYNNTRMLDENGEFIGACGVGSTLENLNNAIDALEKKYGLSVLLADSDGIIKVAGDDSLPGTQVNSYINDYIANFDNNCDYEYEQIGSGGYIIVKYIPEYGWYLCIERPESISAMTKIVLYNLLATLAALVIMVVIISIAMKYQENETMVFKADSETDKMTGLYNRRAFDNMMQTIREGKSIRDISLVVIDVNGLKQTNDEKGHVAGDELITKTAQCINELYGNHGQTFRIGGDEFVIVITEPLDDVEECVKTIRTRISKCRMEYSDELAVAIGIARGEDYMGIGVDELLEVADKAMYSDKEKFYRDKRHERRASRR